MSERALDVLVLLHERESRQGPPSHRIHALVALWREAGLHVAFAHGPREAPKAHVVIPHVDLTHRPVGHDAWLGRQPAVLNRSVLDLSKRRVSTNLLQPDDVWSGPVVVKTDLNFGGHPELRLLGRHGLLGRWARRRPKRWTSARWWPSHEYPVFENLRAVPPEVWSNPRWVVERFLPEREGEAYALRTWTFLGAAGACVRRVGPRAIVKPAHGDPTTEVDVPPEVAARRRELGIDYGKLDFVVNDEVGVVVLDANATPGLPPGPEVLARRALDVALARALAPWLPADRSAQLQSLLDGSDQVGVEGLGATLGP